MKSSAFIIVVFCTGFLFNSCKPEGCTDPKAKNFSYEAQKDDGSCDYSGCTDPDALNYNKDAKEDDGSCTYLGGVQFITTRTSVNINNTFLALEVSGEFIGNLQNDCNIPFLTCESACSHVKFTEKESGGYSYQFWEVRQLSSTTFDTIFESLPISFSVIGNECNIVVIE